jgi:hypothetical protein
VNKFLEFTFAGALMGMIIGLTYAVVWENIPVAIGLGALTTILGIVLGIVNSAK